MSVEENKALVRRVYEEVHNKGNLDAADELLASDFVDHNPFGPNVPPGPEGIKQEFTVFRRAFPDLNATIEEIIAEGDKVVTRLTIRGTHKGEFMGIAATGKQMILSVIDIVRISGGKVAERWGVEDNLGLMRQLGVVPPPGLAGG
ncbi:MAG: ester cyclase [Candidatus Bipolaricaulia bacterium]